MTDTNFSQFLRLGVQGPGAGVWCARCAGGGSVAVEGEREGEIEGAHALWSFL